jgi:hypothetical protein
MDLDQIWWRRITANDFFNIEKELPPGPHGQLHIDVPFVSALFTFLGLPPLLAKSSWVDQPVFAAVASSPTVGSTIIFRPRKPNDRYDIRLQNINAADSERHPAWTPAFGWPSPSPAPTSTATARPHVAGGLTIYLARAVDGSVLAGFTVGARLPAGAPTVFASLFGLPTSQPTAGVIIARGTTLPDLVAVSAATPSPSAGSVGVPAPPPPADAEADDTEIAKRSPDPKAPVRSGGGQGYGLTSTEKKALEVASVEAAKDYFRRAGYTNIRDTGANKPYDLQIEKSGQDYIVEVKGSTTAAAKILLTSGEVTAHAYWHPHNFLYVQAGMTLAKGSPPVASGGTPTVIQAWEPDPADLEITASRYSLPKTP